MAGVLLALVFGLLLVVGLVVGLVLFVLDRIPASSRWIRKASVYVAVVVAFLAAVFIPLWIGVILFPNGPNERLLIAFPMWAVSFGAAYLISRRLIAGLISSKDQTKDQQAEGDDGSQPPILLGEVAIYPHDEATHFLFAGATGSGKTQGINTILKTVRTRRTRAVIADSGGSSLSRFYADGDQIFNPLDARSVQWSPFCEIRVDQDCSNLARAAIPDSAGPLQEWHHYGQMLLTDILRALIRQKTPSTKALLYYMNTAPVRAHASLTADALDTLLGWLGDDSAAQILCTPGNETMLSNTRAVVAPFLSAWRYLPDVGTFSIRDWIRIDSGSNWFFITYRDDQVALLRSLVGTMLDLAIRESLALSESETRDLWFVMDEVDALGKVATLRDALTRLRKYGCKCVLGLQSVSQLRSTYGRDEAQTLMANIGTKVILRAGDGETAEYFSAEFGSSEFVRTQVSKAEGTDSSYRSTTTTTTTDIRQIRRRVLDSELGQLGVGEAYLKTRSELQQVQLTEEAGINPPGTCPAFVPLSTAVPIDRSLTDLSASSGV